MRILLIEDEQPAARQLQRLIHDIRPDADICETLDSVTGSVRWLKNFPSPDLIFMDIQIADGLSFDIFSQTPVESPVIFTTAFDHYAVEAFKVNAVDYLLKPIEPDALSQALKKYEQRAISPLNGDFLSQLLNKRKFKDRFLVKQGQAFGFVEIPEIAFFHSADGLTQAHTFDGKRYFIDHSLDELETLTDPQRFFRISRSTHIALNSIQKVHPHLNGRLKVDSKPNFKDPLYVSRDRAPSFKEWLNGI